MTHSPVYLSTEALEKLQAELKTLKTVRRREVADRIEKAKELGDLSENAEYHDAKDELAWLEGRVMELEDLIARARIIEHGDSDTIGIGSTVKVTNGTKEKTFIITGSVEADPLTGRISNESPLGRAFIGKQVGEKAEIDAPSGHITWTILSIE